MVKVYLCIIQQTVQNWYFLSNNGSPNDVLAILPKIRKHKPGLSISTIQLQGFD